MSDSSKRVIWKHALAVNFLTASARFIMYMPLGSRFLTLQPQGETIALWYEVPDPEAAPQQQFAYQIFGTGQGPIPGHLKYVGTAQFFKGSLVLHVYEE